MLKKTKFGYIAPVEYLHLIPENATFHLILAHLLKDEKYAAFYKKKADRGDVIICDNGAFEFKRSLDPEPLMKLVKDSGVKCTYVVAPDYPFEPWSVTYDSTVNFIEMAKDEDYKIMAVPQSEKGNYKGWLECYKRLSRLDAVEVIGMSILGIPNAFCELTGTEDIATNRIFATAYMKENGLVDSSVSHHYLGLGDGPREILAQRAMGVMDTNDSSSPFWHGIQGVLLDDSATGLANGKSGIEVDFHIEKAKNKFSIDNKKKNVDDMIKENIEWMEKIIGNK
tara:strand:+ start:1999 stop:2844 length:846 start_codon:yes stop_codon:yes gene_type:complete